LVSEVKLQRLEERLQKRRKLGFERENPEDSHDEAPEQNNKIQLLDSVVDR